MGGAGLPRSSAADDPADVIGVQFVKTKLSNNVFSETLVRLDPLGHLYLDPAALFTEAAGLGPHCYRNPRELLTSLSQHEQFQGTPYHKSAMACSGKKVSAEIATPPRSYSVPQHTGKLDDCWLFAKPGHCC